MNIEEIKGILDSLTPEEREAATKIIEEFNKNGNSQLFREMLYKDYDEIPVDVDIFVTSKRYLGNAMEGGKKIYPYWRKVLVDIFSGKKTYNEVVFTGGIGLGKTTIAVIGFLYTLYCMMCLKNPQAYYGLPDKDIITFALYNVTLDLVYKVAYREVQQQLRMSPWFMERGDFIGRGLTAKYKPHKNIEIIFGSRDTHSLGQHIFCLEGSTLVKCVNNAGRFEYIPIDKLTETPKKIVSYDTNLQKIIVGDERVSILTKEEKEIIEIELEDGTVLRGDPDHKVMLSNGEYMELGKIAIGDDLREIK